MLAVDEEMVRSLARLLDETRLTEIEIEQGGLRVRVARQAAAPAPFAIAAAESQRPIAAVINAHAAADPAEHPGLASYLQVLFPRGDAGARLLAAEVEALNRRGYSAETAMVLGSAVATLAISLAAREENNASVTGGDQEVGFALERDAVADRLAGDAQLGAAHVGLPQVSSSEFVRLLLAASIRGLVAVIPPGRPIGEVVAELTAAGEDH